MIKSGDKSQYASKVIEQFFSRRYPSELEERVQKWLLGGDNADLRESALEGYWDKLEVKPSQDAYGSLKEVKKKLGLAAPARKMTLSRRMMRIAAVLVPALILVGGIAVYQATKSVEMATISAAGGERIQQTLPDGTVVWLNSGSTLTYPVKFARKSRNVTLTGEAYFEVAPDEKRPFGVQSQHLTVNVLGTKFNVKAYEDDLQTLVTLLTGKVEVEVSDEVVALVPDRQLVFDSQANTTKVNEVDASAIISWISGDMVFDNASLGEIFKTLERAGIADFEADPSVLPQDGYTVKFSNGEDIAEIMEVLDALTGGMDATLDEGTVYIGSPENRTENKSIK